MFLSSFSHYYLRDYICITLTVVLSPRHFNGLPDFLTATVTARPQYIQSKTGISLLQSSLVDCSGKSYIFGHGTCSRLGAHCDGRWSGVDLMARGIKRNYSNLESLPQSAAIRHQHSVPNILSLLNAFLSVRKAFKEPRCIWLQF